MNYCPRCNRPKEWHELDRRVGVGPRGTLVTRTRVRLLARVVVPEDDGTTRIAIRADDAAYAEARQRVEAARRELMAA